MTMRRRMVSKSIAVLALCSVFAVPRATVGRDDLVAGKAQADSKVSAAKQPSSAEVEAKKAEIARLEVQIQYFRDQLALALDKNNEPTLTLDAAKAQLRDAEKALDLARIAAKEYEEGTYPQEEQSAIGQVKLAESELVKAKDYYEYWKRRFADQLALQKAEFTLKEAETKLLVLRKYGRVKALRDLGINIAKAEADVAAKRLRVKRITDREAAKGQADRGVESRDKIQSLLNEAIAVEDVLVTRLQNAKELQSKIDADPARAKQMQAELKTLRVEIAALASKADAQMTEALDVAEHIRAPRAFLREKEAQLRNAYEELNALQLRSETASPQSVKPDGITPTKSNP